MIGDHVRLLAQMRTDGALRPPPTEEDLRRHAEICIAARGWLPAQRNYVYLHRVAAEIWGAGRTAHFARAWRAAAIEAKAVPEDRWAAARRAVEALPGEWRDALMEVVERSAAAEAAPYRQARGTLWSVDHAASVASALDRWVAHRRKMGAADFLTTGITLDAWGWWLVDPARRDGSAVSTGSAAHYISRAMSGIAVVAPEAATPACAFVVRDWRDRGRAEGARTKTGEQLVGAATIHALGLDLVAEAEAAPRRGLRSASRYRDGLLLVLATLMPQRARALSCLRFDSSLLLEEDAIRIEIPARFLKLYEAEKSRTEPYRRVLRGRRLFEIVDRYRREFRPIVDDGDAVFPSVLTRGQPLSSRRLGVICGDLTEARLGVRVSIHRIRDNVATDAAEQLVGGGLAAASLLDHADPLTTARHYDHGGGQEAMRSFGEMLDRRRSPMPSIDL